MTESGHNGFWAEGPERLREAFGERRSFLDTLFRRFRQARSESEREEVEAEVREVFAEYHPTEEEMKHCLHLLR